MYVHVHLHEVCTLGILTFSHYVWFEDVATPTILLELPNIVVHWFTRSLVVKSNCGRVRSTMASVGDI